MSDHSEVVYKNSCVKLPKHKKNRHLQQLDKQMRKLSIESTDSDSGKSEKQRIKSFLAFYDSIPEYDDVNHLSNKDFYTKLESLRERQRAFYASIANEHGSNFEGWVDNYKSLNNCRNSIIKCKTDDELLQKPPSRRSVRIESPEVLDDRENRCKSRANISSAGSMCRTKSRKSPYNDCTLDDLSDCTMTTKSAPCSPRKQLGWKKDSGYKSSTPETFKLTVQNEDDKIIDEILINNKSANKAIKTACDNLHGKNEMFRANPVPIESRIPLFDKIMCEQEQRRQHVKKQSKDALKSRMRLFSFTKREEEIADITRRLSKSSPELFAPYEKHKPTQFKAKPVPRNLFSNYIYRKMHEDQYYRSLQKKIRAEEMLKTASLPPSMAKREKSKPKFNMCPKSFRDMYESQLSRFPPATQRDLGKELAELELDFIMSTPSPVGKSKSKPKRKKPRKSSSSSSSKSSRCTSTLESVNRSNLAAVLRIQTSRKRMEEEIKRRLEEARQREEARWREKVMRKRPVWQSLAYSHEEDLNMRLQMRKDEERLRSEEHKMHMQTMLGRVNQQPTLFERQSNSKLAITREDFLAQLHADILNGEYSHHVDDHASPSTSNGSGRKCIEMKDEAIQARFDEIFHDSDGDEPKEASIFDSNHKGTREIGDEDKNCETD